MQTENDTKASKNTGWSAPLQRGRADVEGLHHVHGTMLVRVQGTPIGALQVDDGRAEFRPGLDQGDVTADFNDGEDIPRLLRGELNPVVASLQRRMLLKGDVCLGARIMLGLRTGASFAPVLE